jgi:hypothetical protein
LRPPIFGFALLKQNWVPRVREESLPHKGNDVSACSGNMSHLVCVCFYKQDSIQVLYGGTRPISVLRSSTRPGLARVRE